MWLIIEMSLISLYSEMEENMFGNFFSQREYSLQMFEYLSFKQPYKASCTSATDYDLTGQVLWPAAKLLSK